MCCVAGFGLTGGRVLIVRFDLKIYTTCTPTRLPLKLRHTPWHSARHYFLISYICQQSPDTSQYILLVAE